MVANLPSKRVSPRAPCRGPNFFHLPLMRMSRKPHCCNRRFGGLLTHPILNEAYALDLAEEIHGVYPESSAEWQLASTGVAIAAGDDPCLDPKLAEWVSQDLSHLHVKSSFPVGPIKILSANVTSWRQEIQDWATHLEPHAFCVQETHLLGDKLHLAKVNAEKAGWQATGFAGSPGEGTGILGGHGVLTPATIQRRTGPHHLQDGLGFTGVILHLQGIHIAVFSVYLQSGGCINTAPNIGIVAALLATLATCTTPWIVTGDWNQDVD